MFYPSEGTKSDRWSAWLRRTLLGRTVFSRRHDAETVSHPHEPPFRLGPRTRHSRARTDSLFPSSLLGLGSPSASILRRADGRARQIRRSHDRHPGNARLALLSALLIADDDMLPGLGRRTRHSTRRARPRDRFARRMASGEVETKWFKRRARAITEIPAHWHAGCRGARSWRRRPCGRSRA